MFDDVGRYRDDEMGKRRLLASMSTAGLGGLGAMLLLIASTARAPAAPIPTPEEIPDGDFDRIETVEVSLEGMSAPPPPKRGTPDLPVEDEPEPTAPDEPVDTPAPLDDTPPDTPVKEAPQTSGTPDGTDDPNARPDGVKGGTGTNPEGKCIGLACEGTGDGEGSSRGTLRHKAAKLKPIQQPSYPSAAKDLELGEQACMVQVDVSAKGKPETVRVSGCHPAFHASAKKAAYGWRWYPARKGRQAVASSTRVRIVYRLRDAR